MSLREEKAADLAQLLQEIGEPVAWNGTTYQALVTAAVFSQEFVVGGFADAADFAVKIPLAVFPDQRPEHGDRMMFEEKEYRITRVTTHPQYPMLVLALSSPDE
jgi:hypothetical protein